MHSTARRARLENEAAYPFPLKTLHFFLDPTRQHIGHVFFRFDRDQADLPGITDKLHRLAWNGHAGFLLGTDRHPLDERADCVNQMLVEFVPAVIANVVAEKAGADADFDFSWH